MRVCGAETEAITGWPDDKIASEGRRRQEEEYSTCHLQIYVLEEREYSRGLRTQPWGAPAPRHSLEDRCGLSLTVCALLDRKSLIHLKTPSGEVFCCLLRGHWQVVLAWH